MTALHGDGGTRVADAMRELILSGELKPGQRISQEGLAERFNTSRMPVREALAQLAVEELVMLVPRSGAWVSGMSAEEFDRAYLLRESLEPLVARQSLPNLSDDQLKHIEELGVELDEVTGHADRFEDFIRIDREFHLAVYEGAQFSGYRDRVEQLWNKTHQYRRVIYPEQTDREIEATRADHALLRYYVHFRDGEGLGDLIRMHIRRTRLIADRKPTSFE